MKKLLIPLVLIILIGAIFFATKNQAPTITQILNIGNTEKVVSYPGDFSCQPNECEDLIQSGINGISYPSCNSNVQINNTATSDSKSCAYWRTQQKYFGTEDYVDLSALSKQGKASRGEAIIDGFLGMSDEIEVHRKAADIFLKAEAKFNSLYGSNRKGSTYYLQSYPSGYTFSFSGSLNKRGVTGNTNTEDTLEYEDKNFVPSNHFWGVAIDLNSETNWGNRLTPGACQFDIPPEIVSVFESVGLRWGGRYFNDGDLKNYMDPMHFEYLPDCIKPGL